MSKILTEIEFSNLITQDRTWRLREISDLKSAIIKADDSLRRVLLRALVTLCYAHWEGYVRFGAKAYIDYVARRKLKFTELDRQFYRNYFLPRLTALSQQKTSLHERSDLIETILISGENRFSRENNDLIDTKSNLNSKVMSEICLVCALPDEDFTARKTFIDVLLLKRRNSIAHGEDTLVHLDDLDELTNDTVDLMRIFGNALENRVALNQYRRVPRS